jgi:hypothetical protein
VLKDLYKRSEAVCGALGSILESDEEMDLMYLTFANEERSNPGSTLDKVYGGQMPRRASAIAASSPPRPLEPLSGAQGTGRVSQHMAPAEGNRAAETALRSEVDAALRHAVLMTGGTLGGTGAAVDPSPLAPPSHDEIEVLLESFLQSTSNVSHEVSQMRGELDAREHMIELTLEVTRNKLLKLDMIFQIMSFSVSVGALVAGILGMNLMNRAEATQYAFAWTSGGIMIGVIALMCVMYFVATKWL